MAVGAVGGLTVARASAQSGEMKGIWGAIAYSPADGRHGFFWGADKKEEAEKSALQGCRADGGDACDIISVFRNHRHRSDDDETGFPYEPCAALSVGANGAMGAASATTRLDAEERSAEICGGDANGCKIREWVCT